jgi:hypothetical protein
MRDPQVTCQFTDVEVNKVLGPAFAALRQMIVDNSPDSHRTTPEFEGETDINTCGLIVGAMLRAVATGSWDHGKLEMMMTRAGHEKALFAAGYSVGSFMRSTGVTGIELLRDMQVILNTAMEFSQPLRNPGLLERPAEGQA